MKSCIKGKEKHGQIVSRIPSQRKVSRLVRPIKKESDITIRQKSVKEGFNIRIRQPVQRANTIQNLSVPEELVCAEPVPQEQDQNVSATGDKR